MGKVAVLYQSRYGTAKQYAEWIAEETGGTLFTLPKVKLADLEGYDTIVIGGGIYASSILGIAFLKKNFALLSGKRLIAFSVGASFDGKKNTDAIRNHNLTPEMQETVRFFHLRGGLFYGKMSALDRTGMKLMVGMLKKKPEDQWDEETRGMIETYGKDTSFLDRASIAPILAAVNA
jgi:menaquinone-dependent protoporphyrinogen IX oxidase